MQTLIRSLFFPTGINVCSIKTQSSLKKWDYYDFWRCNFSPCQHILYSIPLYLYPDSASNNKFIFRKNLFPTQVPKREENWVCIKINHNCERHEYWIIPEKLSIIAAALSKWIMFSKIYLAHTRIYICEKWDEMMGNQRRGIFLCICFLMRKSNKEFH